MYIVSGDTKMLRNNYMRGKLMPTIQESKNKLFYNETDSYVYSVI